jgi:hypothetical protein
MIASASASASFLAVAAASLTACDCCITMVLIRKKRFDSLALRAADRLLLGRDALVGRGRLDN